MIRSITSVARVRQASLALLPTVLVSCAIFTAGSVPTPRPKEAPHTLAPEARGSKFAVATENGEASRIAIEVLRAGGDAVDAAAAAALALGVATPTACGIGGGGFAVVYRAKTKETLVIDFREVGPAAIDAAAFEKRPFGPNERGHYVGVPGEVAGLHLLVTKYGKRAWRDDVLPAANLAKTGFTFTSHVARGTREHEKELRTLAPLLGAKLLAASGPLPIGSKITRPDLAATLQTIADQGPKAFYAGALTTAMVSAVRDAGGTLTADDFAKYAPKVRTAIRIKVGARELITMPPPSAGGLMLGETLRAHEVMRAKDGQGFLAEPWGTSATMHMLAELMRGAIDDRRFIADPDAVPVDVNELIADARLQKRIAMIDPWSSKLGAELRIDEHGTSHISIVDAEGNAVALTTTVNTGFGATLIAGDTGIVMNDQLDDFSNSKPNVPRPFARPTSSMTPTIVLEDGLPVMVAGGSGGMRIATSVTLVSVAHLVFGLSAGDAVGWPRIHQKGTKLTHEATLPPTVVAELGKRGEQLEVAEAMNAVQLVTVVRKGGTSSFVAASDPRKGGVALAE
jgi:gamma-glutamyltranspeptidase/glutathione hydrolase